MKRTYFLLYVFLACFLTSCATVSRATTAKYPNFNYLPTDPKNVVVYQTPPPVSYEVIGEVEGGHVYQNDSWREIKEDMKMEAAKIGGDAIIIQSEETPLVASYAQPGRISGETTEEVKDPKAQEALKVVQSQTDYTYTPPATVSVYGKRARGVVIKFK